VPNRKALRAGSRQSTISSLSELQKGKNYFFTPYYQDTKFSTKTGQISLRVLWWKWFGMWGHYFGSEVRLLTVFAVNPWGETV
jgi:hypothetical protein